MHMELGPIIDLVKWMVAVTATAFAVFLFLDERHAHTEDVTHTDVELRERIMVSESTRYAEIAKFYTDKLKAGETLTEAELARLELVQRQQERIADTLTKDQE